LGLKLMPQLEFRQSFDASSPARFHWLSREHLITVSSSSDNCACGNCTLAGQRILAHKCKLETKLTLENSLRMVHSVMQLLEKGMAKSLNSLNMKAEMKT